MRWTGILLLAGLAGCADADRPGTALRNKPVTVPATPEASLTAAARVDRIGGQLTAQSPFLGVEPIFQTVGRPEPEVGHPDLNRVIVTEGLVNRCRSDDELAAVLALELSKMSAERRAADRLRPDPPPQLPAAESASRIGVGSDLSQLGTQAVLDRKTGGHRRTTGEAPRADEILKSGGFEPKAVDAVAPLVEEASRNHALADTFGGRGAKPRWSN